MSEPKEFRDALDDLAAGAAAEAEAPADQGAEAAADTHPSVPALRGRFADAILHHTIMAGDEHVVRVTRERLVDVISWLHSEPDQHYDLLQDLTAVDWGGGRPIDIVYQIWSIPHRRALRLKTALPLDDLEMPTVSHIFATADWLEREVFDLFGVRFTGHADLRRILMPDNYAEGHPLRKDFPLRGRVSRAEQTRRALAFAVEEHYAPQELSVIEEVERHHRSRAAGEGES